MGKFDDVDLGGDQTMRRMVENQNKACDVRLASLIRQVSAMHERSWNPEAWRDNSGEWRGEYKLSYYECIHICAGKGNPICHILDCLFTAGYSDMYDFADEVLGKEPTND